MMHSSFLQLHDLSHIKRAVFVSDIHLTSSMPLTAHYFQLFLREYAKAYDGIFILGDLFEYWIGDEVLNAQTANAHMYSSICHDLAQQRNVFFIKGNRDFLIGTNFLKASKMILLPDPCYIKIGNAHFWLAHGDGWCFLDKKYQMFRWLVRIPTLQKLFLDLPYRWREGVAQKMRQKSRQNMKIGQSNIQSIPAWADVPSAGINRKVKQIFSNKSLNFIIHGHTHLPSIHEQDRDIKRWVLPDWDYDGSTTKGDLLVLEDNVLHWESFVPRSLSNGNL